MISTTVVRSSIGNVVRRTASRRSCLASASCSSSVADFLDDKQRHRRFYTTPAEEEKFRQEGFLDEKGLTIFNTLHEMIHGSCRVYAHNELFGTYSPTTEKFEYMTYEEFGNKVNQCRSMLKNLGKLF